MSTRLILARTAGEADHYRRTKLSPTDNYRALLATSPKVIDGTCPTEVHVAPGADQHPEFDELIRTVLRCEKKMPVQATWFWNGTPIYRQEALRRLGVTQEPSPAERRGGEADQARLFVSAALEPTSMLYRTHGPDRLLAAAQVLATLARP